MTVRCLGQERVVRAASIASVTISPESNPVPPENDPRNHIELLVLGGGKRMQRRSYLVERQQVVRRAVVSFAFSHRWPACVWPSDFIAPAATVSDKEFFVRNGRGRSNREQDA